MAAHYVNVTGQEMQEHLSPQGFKPIKASGTAEVVYGKRVDRDGLQLTIRVYTGIVNGQSRECGDDAMRVTIFLRTDDGTVKMVGGSKRVHRVEGWRTNLQNRLDGWHALLGPKCECGSLMVERAYKCSKFWGCIKFPQCRLTKQKEAKQVAS